MSKHTVAFLALDDEGCDLEVTLPGTAAVCSKCDGTGTHVNEAIDGNGISTEDWERDWDDESKAAYFDGAYDVTCTECNGARIEVNVDEAACKRQGLEKELEEYYAYLREDAEYEALCEAERRMGA